MDNTNRNRRAFIEQLARANREFYGTPNGRGVLRAFELTFEHRWTYIFELVQNALDAGARSIALRIVEDGDALTFQHDGHRSMGDKDVEALSNVFRSTKGASTVGFMGVGFKSVFSRFQEARISGWGWTFRYEIDQIKGEKYGDVQPDLLGAVVPIWDDSIAVPDPGFTTRFEMRRRKDAGADLRSDLAHFLSDDDRTPLAILAASGLERLAVNDRVWGLSVAEKQDGSSEVTARSGNEILLWQLFSMLFEPSRKAIARFLEHRSIQPSEDELEQVYTDAARPRRVLGLMPLDDDGMPAPPARGGVYATLPTDVTLPFGLHINADWLLNISRSGVREIEDNAWQREIVDRIADVLASYLGWVSRSLSAPAAVRAAFGALASPTAERSGLEAQLARESWQSRLRNCLEDAAVFPVWTGAADALGFAKPGGLIVPPPPLAEAFAEEPDLRPSVLLQGPVLMSELLGADALHLLERIGLFTEMSPRALKHAWPDGLKTWWRTLADEPDRRRHLLFRIWAVIAALAHDDAWQDVDFPCCRTVTGKWLPVGEVVYLNERLPSKRGPGGPEVRQFIEPFIPDANRVPDKWIVELRQGAARETKERHPGTLSRAWKWIRDHARSIGLREVVADAMHALVSSPAPDWSALVPLGHWAKHRNCPDLLTLVRVDAEGGPKGVPAGESLLGDPYVECGRDRRRLFPTAPAISADYLEQDPKHADAREWRAFLENAGAKGALAVQPVKDHASRWEHERVAEFLGLEVDVISESNNSGYELLDFDIEANLPGTGAPEELRAALATWLADGFNVLKGKGSRQTRYTYYTVCNRKGSTPSAWAAKLSELAWVPCDDGTLRRPEDVLPRSDPAREAAPVAKLSGELLSVLDQEGVEFGTAIPTATSLHKLSALGTKLHAQDLAQLLHECREQITTDGDRRHFEQILRELTVPSNDGKRVPLDRIVQRVGGRLRGSIGGWIVPLDLIDEALRAELEHSDFPYEFPNTTTGHQALAYLREVWTRARSASERLANEVRDVLPAAYAYCLEDCSTDASLSERWRAAVPEASVFAEREWIVLTEADDIIYFDDLEDRRFFPSQGQLRIVTGGHLGNFRSVQLRTAEALDLPLLSSSVTMKWHGEDKTLPVADDWVSRFVLVCELLRRVRGRERTAGDGMGTETGTELELIRVRELALDVSVESNPAERVPVNARLREGVLTVAGRPVQFGADATKELLRHFSFGQRGDLAADLTGMLGSIDNQPDFNLAADKFRRSFAPDFEFPALFRVGSDNDEAAGSGDESARTTDAIEFTTERQTGVDESAPSSALFGDSKLDESGPPGNASTAGLSHTPSTSSHDESGSAGGSYTRARSLARQSALADQLRNSLKGEITPSDDDDEVSKATRADGNPGANLGDEVYREVAAQYERKSGLEPEFGAPHQTGWDIRSVDLETGAVRLIEVKGKGCPWVDDEAVELSRAQVRKAFEAAEQTIGSWYLYVVEKTDNGEYQVLPIANPVRIATKWILCGESWRMVAEDPKRVASPST